MKLKLLLLVALLIYSCNSSDNKSVSLYNFLPDDSSVVISINDLNNTKEILNKNKLLPAVLSSTKEITTQLDLLSHNKSDRSGLLSLSAYGKDEIAFTYIRESNSFDSIQEVDILKNTYQKNELFVVIYEIFSFSFLNELTLLKIYKLDPKVKIDPNIR